MTSVAGRLFFAVVPLLCAFAIEQGLHTSPLQKEATFTKATVLTGQETRTPSTPIQKKLSLKNVAVADQTALGQKQENADVGEAMTHAAKSPLLTGVQTTKLAAHESGETIPRPVELHQGLSSGTELSSSSYRSKTHHAAKTALIRSEKRHKHKRYHSHSLFVGIPSLASGETLNLQFKQESPIHSEDLRGKDDQILDKSVSQKRHGKDSAHSSSVVMNAQGDVQQPLVGVVSSESAEVKSSVTSANREQLVPRQDGSGYPSLAERVMSRSVVNVVMVVLTVIVVVLFALVLFQWVQGPGNAAGPVSPGTVKEGRLSSRRKSKEERRSSRGSLHQSGGESDDGRSPGRRTGQANRASLASSASNFLDEDERQESLARRKEDMYTSARQAMDQKGSSVWTATVDAFVAAQGSNFNAKHPSHTQYLKHMKTPVVGEQIQDLFTELSKGLRAQGAEEQGAEMVGVEEMVLMCSNFFSSIRNPQNGETWRTSPFTHEHYGWLTESIREPMDRQQFHNVFALWHLVVMLGARMELEEQDDALKELVCKAVELQMECQVKLSGGRVPYRATLSWKRTLQVGDLGESTSNLMFTAEPSVMQFDVSGSLRGFGEDVAERKKEKMRRLSEEVLEEEDSQ